MAVIMFIWPLWGGEGIEIEFAYVKCEFDGLNKVNLSGPPLLKWYSKRRLQMPIVLCKTSLKNLSEGLVRPAAHTESC